MAIRIFVKATIDVEYEYPIDLNFEPMNETLRGFQQRAYTAVERSIQCDFQKIIKGAPNITELQIHVTEEPEGG